MNICKFSKLVTYDLEKSNHSNQNVVKVNIWSYPRIIIGNAIKSSRNNCRLQRLIVGINTPCQTIHFHRNCCHLALIQTKSITENNTRFVQDIVVDMADRRFAPRAGQIGPRVATACHQHSPYLAPGQLSSKETLQRWRAFGNFMSNLTGQGIELLTSYADCDVLNHYTTPNAICLASPTRFYLKNLPLKN